MNEQPVPPFDDQPIERAAAEYQGAEYRGAEEPVIAESTGHPAVDAALEALAQVATAPPADQVPAYQAAQRTLRESLDSIDKQ